MRPAQRFRETALPAADRLASPWGFYAAYSIGDEQIARLSDVKTRWAICAMRTVGFKPVWLSALKYRSSARNRHDVASLRYVPDEHPTVDARIVDEWAPDECQYHLHLFDVDDALEVYSHYELRPDLLRPSPSIERLRTHYRPEYGEDYLKGLAPHDVREWVSVQRETV